MCVLRLIGQRTHTGGGEDTEGGGEAAAGGGEETDGGGETALCMLALSQLSLSMENNIQARNYLPGAGRNPKEVVRPHSEAGKPQMEAERRRKVAVRPRSAWLG